MPTADLFGRAVYFYLSVCVCTKFDKYSSESIILPVRRPHSMDAFFAERVK